MAYFCKECHPHKLCTTVKDLNQHYKDLHDPLDSYPCAFPSCAKRFLDKRSMVRHLTSANSHTDLPPCARNEDVIPDEVAPHQQYDGNNDDNDDNDNDTISMIHEDVQDEATPPPLSVEEEVKKAAIQLLIDLRSTASLTGKAVERFERSCDNMLQTFSVSAKAKIAESLRKKNLSEEEINEIVKDLDVPDPFKNLKTIEDQLRYFSEHYGLVIPEEMFLDSRIDKRLDPATNSYVPCQVSETFQYISLIGTLTAIVSNKKARELLKKTSSSSDGVIRSYMDGSHYKDHPHIRKYENVLFILLFFDELEISNSLGSKTIIHKLATFFFQVLNFPAELSSELSSIHLLLLAYADDLKKPGALEKILIPLVQELKKLGSPEGVTIEVDGELFVLRAILVAVTADTLAAHDLLGFLGVGARHFCRWCMVKRSVVRADANATGLKRTPRQHEQHVGKVLNNRKFRTECGVKSGTRLNKAPFFHCVENSVFDAFHDLLEGIVPLIMKLVLRHYITVKKFLTVEDLNSRIQSFSYGIPDAKNKPSANFSDGMLNSKKSKLSQSGSQMWCLIRSLPFLLRDFVCDVDEHLQLIFLLQDLMQIIFSFQITVADVEELRDLIYRHNALFFKLFIAEDCGVLEDEDDAEENDEEELEGEVNEAAEAADQEEQVQQPKLKVYVINKLHHLTHYPDMVLKFGNPVRMWCAKFEGRLKIFRQHASICCNFRNPPKTMARMFQLSNLKSIISPHYEMSLEFQRGREVNVGMSPFRDILQDFNLDKVIFTNSATVQGEEYRPGLFVCLSGGTARYPKFGLIKEVIVADKSVILIVSLWKNNGKDERFNCCEVCPEDNPQEIAVKTTSLASHRCIGPWPGNNDEIYLSLRTVLVPLEIIKLNILPMTTGILLLFNENQVNLILCNKCLFLDDIYHRVTFIFGADSSCLHPLNVTPLIHAEVEHERKTFNLLLNLFVALLSQSNLVAPAFFC